MSVAATDIRQQVMRLMETSLRRPLGAKIEGNTLCNSRCVFCAYRKVKRPYSMLSMKLFEKVACQFDELGGGYMDFAGMIADPLLDTLLMERLKFLRDKCPAITPHMFTNAIGFTRFSDEQIVTLLESLDHIDISVGGLDEDEYRQMFGVDKFADVWNSLERLAGLKSQTGNSCRLAVHIRTKNSEAILANRRLRELIDMGYECNDVLSCFATWDGIVTQDDLPAGAKIDHRDNSAARSMCLMGLVYFSVLADGRVTSCACVDAKAATVIGDLNKQTLMEIWTGQDRLKFLKAFSTGNMFQICRTCGYYSPAEQFFAQPKFADFQPWENIWA